MESLRSGLTSPSLVSASVALKAVAVNVSSLASDVMSKYGHSLFKSGVFSSSFSSDLQDEICKSIAESGGIDVIFKCIDDSGEHGNKIVARACCSLLSKVQRDSGS